MVQKEFIFDNAEGAETRTRKLNIIENEVDVLQARDALDYSVEEQATGVKWTDGKMIYQKTLSLSGLTGTGAKTLAHGITGLLNVTKFESGYVILASGVKAPIPRVSTDMTANSIYFYGWDTTNLTGYVGTAYATTSAIASGYITIQYTKA